MNKFIHIGVCVCESIHLYTGNACRSIIFILDISISHTRDFNPDIFSVAVRLSRWIYNMTPGDFGFVSRTQENETIFISIVPSITIILRWQLLSGTRSFARYRQLIYAWERWKYYSVFLFIVFFFELVLTVLVSVSCRHRFVVRSRAMAVISVDLDLRLHSLHRWTRDHRVALVCDPVATATAMVGGESPRRTRGPLLYLLSYHRDTVPYSQMTTKWTNAKNTKIYLFRFFKITFIYVFMYWNFFKGVEGEVKMCGIINWRKKAKEIWMKHGKKIPEKWSPKNGPIEKKSPEKWCPGKNSGKEDPQKNGSWKNGPRKMVP